MADCLKGSIVKRVWYYIGRSGSICEQLGHGQLAWLLVGHRQAYVLCLAWVGLWGVVACRGCPTAFVGMQPGVLPVTLACKSLSAMTWGIQRLPDCLCGSAAKRVCYYTGLPGSVYEDLGHAEVVQVDLKGNAEASEDQMRRFAETYFSQFRKTPKGMQRLDPQDAGPAYRNVVGIPGGVRSPLFKILEVNIALLAAHPGSLPWLGILPCTP